MKRIRLMRSWYSFVGPQGRVGLRYHGLNQWGVYFRDRKGMPTGATPYPGKMIYVRRYKTGKRLAQQFHGVKK